MIALTAALLLAVLAALNRRIAGSWLYPPAFFTAYWSVLLIALYASGDMFYPISLATVVLLFVGKLAFSLGGLVVLITLVAVLGVSCPIRTPAASSPCVSSSTVASSCF